jgi:biopolymer transport protein TolR
MSTAFGHRRHKKRKLKAEINVVPYIDVMLVLLIIFMVTAPLLNLGVDVDLPKANAKSVESKQQPVLILVGADGSLRMKLEKTAPEAMDGSTLQARIKAMSAANPELAVMVAGDSKASYETVYAAMVAVQQAGVTKIGLMSKPAD